MLNANILEKQKNYNTAIAAYDVPEFGGAPGATVRSGVYRYRP